MLKVGVTGSIGSGKTTVCRIFETLGVPVYYADTRAKYLLQNDEKVKQQVFSVFGNTISGPGNLINRAALANIVFKDATKLAALEGIIHPAVFEDFNEWFTRQRAPYIIKEAALLFEAGTYKQLDKLIAVSAPLETRIQRVLARDHITREQILARENNQWPDQKKIDMADFVIYNGERQLLMPQVLELHKVFLSLQQ